MVDNAEKGKEQGGGTRCSENVASGGLGCDMWKAGDTGNTPPPSYGDDNRIIWEAAKAYVPCAVWCLAIGSYRLSVYTYAVSTALVAVKEKRAVGM